MSLKNLIIAVCLCLLVVSAALANVPQMINYQGKITTPQGGLINATVSMIFSIYDDSTDGTALWTETHDSVKVEKGIFSVLLGSVNEIPDSVFDGNVRYLGVTVGEDSEMTPRKAIVSVGYAYKAEYADTADYAQVAVSDGDWTPDTSGINIYRLTGNVGIGTTSPTTYGKLTIANPGAYSGIVFTDTGYTSDPSGLMKLALINGNSYIAQYPAGGGSTINEISSNGNSYITGGNVGIGTTNPQGKLDINGSLAVAGDQGTSGQVLTSQGSGANPVWSDVTAVPDDNSVSQAKLKTAIGEVSTTVPSSLLTLPGGEYGFYPQFKTSADIGVGAIMLGRFTSDIKSSFEPGHMNLPSYSTSILLSERDDGTLYAKQRYVTSSGRDHWMFFLIDKDTKQVLAAYQAPDHPCYGSGGDENDIPHPFGSYDAQKHDVVLVANDILPELKSKVTSKRSLLTIVNEEYEIDFDSEPVYQPREIIEIDEYGDKRGEILQKIKTPEWAKILIGKDEIYLKRRLVETLPDYMSYKELKPKSEAIAETPVLSQHTESQPDTR